MARTELQNLTISEAAGLLERRALSPVELTEAVLQRIAVVDKKLNAYITTCGDQAREVAQAAEKMIRAGYHLGPLHGIPVALKDNIYTRGVRTTAGSKILGDFIPAEDATVTARLQRAGAGLGGKTNLHEFALGGTTDNPHYGTCRNPWNPERFPAGSSGGSGAAVAARPCPGALGTHTRGPVPLAPSGDGVVRGPPAVGPGRQPQIRPPGRGDG